jgi:hypothetical protein
MREELVRLLQEKVGLDQQKAEQAVDVFLQYAREHGPELLKSAGSQSGLGGIFGR